MVNKALIRQAVSGGGAGVLRGTSEGISRGIHCYMIKSLTLCGSSFYSPTISGI